MKIYFSTCTRCMNLILFTVIVSFIPVIPTVAAEFTITGTITFEKTGALHLFLVNEAQYNCPDEDDQAQGQAAPVCDGEIAKVTFSPNAQELQQKAIAFTLTNIPQGMYAIQVYQDVNGNNDFDEGALGPKEPWGMSQLVKKPRLRAPRWDEVKFDVKQDIINMNIIVK